MKLIEILARELKEWPEENPIDVGQAADGDIHVPGQSGEFIRHLGVRLTIADDSNSANVTRDEWEVARQSTTPTLETMLAEWRDLTARAQAAQAEADALFEHAGQCHGEIVVRLAELGWGAPRMVPGEPVVTLDDSDGWIEWNGGKCPVVEGTLIDQKLRDGRVYRGSRVGDFGNSTRGIFWRHDGDGAEVVAYRLTPSTQQ